MNKIRVLNINGSYYDMGYQHGKQYHDAIHEFTQDRVQLSGTEAWTGRNISQAAVLALADELVAAHEAYSPELMQELRGMADATGLSVGQLIINNGFTDFIDTVFAVGDITQPQNPEIAADNCTAFLVANELTADGRGMFGQTWDMHNTATGHVILVDGQPDNAPRFLTFTIAGCIGMIGMNEHGIAVGINNLLGADGQIGVTWNFVVRKILMQDNIEAALACITDANLAGAHNYLLMDKHGNGYNVERMATRYHVDELSANSLVHTNHCVIPDNLPAERPRDAESQASSTKRLNRAHDLLANGNLSPEDLMQITRDEEAICVRATPPRYVESCGAAIMRPASGDFWAVWGLPSENEYEHFRV